MGRVKWPYREKVTLGGIYEKSSLSIYFIIREVVL